MISCFLALRAFFFCNLTISSISMNSNSRPVSQLIRNRDLEEPKKCSWKDWRKAKELEEARKAGKAPAAVDEDGKDINPHLPQYISSAPWYFGAKTATLKHQRLQPDRRENCSMMRDKYVRGLKRPRKVMAKYSQFHFAADDVLLPKLNLSYDAKRDRWSKYDPAQYQTCIDDHAKIIEAKHHLKEEKLKQDYKTGETNRTKEQTGDADCDDEEKYADNADMPGTKVDSKHITVRNFRIREDTAKYLRNLDLNSAYYDPKSRSMRDNPYKTSCKTPKELNYAGDNFVRYTGDAIKHSRMNLFAWEAYGKGVEVNLFSEPTKAELLYREFEMKKEEVKDNIKGGILVKYGGEEYLEAPPKQLNFAQTKCQGQINTGMYTMRTKRYWQENHRRQKKNPFRS